MIRARRFISWGILPLPNTRFNVEVFPFSRAQVLITPFDTPIIDFQDPAFYTDFMPSPLHGHAYKIYDLQMPEHERSEYWERKMNAIYFSHPELFLKILSTSGLCSFLRHHLPREGLLLDGGCGSNYFASLFDTETRKVVGLDFAFDSLFQGKQFNPQNLCACGDLNDLPFKDDCFEGVLSISAAEHLEQGPMRLFAETFRVLKPGGVFLLFFPTTNPEDTLFDLVQRRTPSDERGLKPIPHFGTPKRYKRVTALCEEHTQGFFSYWLNRRTLSAMLRTTGFRIDRCTPLDLMGGLVRSRLFGKKALPFVQNVIKRIMEGISPKNTGRLARLLIHEEVFEDRWWYLVHGLIGQWYRYGLGFVCRKPW